MEFDNLFFEVEKVSAESLLVVHNGVEEKMTAEEIFDAGKFTKLTAVSYVSSPKFFAETIKDEAILYSFTAPFIWKIRQQCSVKFDKAAVADIPIFCIIGGSSYSGKSTALEFIARLLGQHGNKKFYDYTRELDKAGIVYSFLKSNNLMPVFADEVSLSFFRRSNSPHKGEEMIKSLSNEVLSEPMGTFIATTNLKDFSSSSQVIRRIYFIGVDNVFDKKREYETKKFLRKIYDGLNDDLFKDFTFRF